LQKITYILLILAVLINGCSPARKAAKTSGERAVNGETTASTIESVIRNNLSNNDFYIQKADINIIQDNISVRLFADIKFRKPDTLLITVRSRTGIEAGRAFITKDTLIIRDRINKKLLIGKPDAIGAKYGVNPSFIMTILGDIIVEDKDRGQPVRCVRGDFTREFEVNDKKVTYIIDCQRNKLKQAYFEGDVRSGNITIGMSDYERSGNVVYPGKIEINDDLKSLGVIIEIKRIESTWKGKIGILAGLGYKVVKIR